MEPKDPKTYLWRRICDLIGQESPSVDAVTKRLGIGRGTVQRIKEGETSVGTEKLVEIAKAFDLEVWELLKPPGAQDQEIDWHTLAVQIAMDHKKAPPEVRAVLLDFAELVRSERARMLQAIADRAKQHTPIVVKG